MDRGRPLAPELPAWHRMLGTAARALLTAARSERTGPWADPGRETVWIHAASLGESKGVETLLALLPAESATTITCTTRAGVLRLRSRGIPALFLPCDDSATAAEFIRARRVRRALFLEAEAWPAILRTLESLEIPVAFAALRSGPGSMRRWRILSALFPGWNSGVEVAWTDRTDSVDAVRALGFADARPGAPFKWIGPLPEPGPGTGPDAAISLHLRDLRTLARLVQGRRDRGWLWFPRHPRWAPVFRLQARMLGLRVVETGAPGPGEVHVSGRLGEVPRLLPSCRSAWVSPGHDLQEPRRFGVPRVETGDPPRSVRADTTDSVLSLDEIVRWLGA